MRSELGIKHNGLDFDSELFNNDKIRSLLNKAERK